MNFLDKLTLMMKHKNLNKNTLAKACDIPYTTIDGWFKKGYEGIKLPTIKKLAEFFNTSIDYWVLDDISNENYGRTTDLYLTNNECEYIKKYRNLDSYGKDMVDIVLAKEYERCTAPDNTTMAVNEPIRIYPYLGNVASAGAGDYIADIPIDTIEAPYIEGADFIIGVSGDSMEPDYHSGDKLYVEKTLDIHTGDIGIFNKAGSLFLKEAGTDRLISHNKDFADIYADTDDISIVGKVLGKMR